MVGVLHKYKAGLTLSPVSTHRSTSFIMVTQPQRDPNYKVVLYKVALVHPRIHHAPT